jgi:hypothetical protein
VERAAVPGLVRVAEMEHHHHKDRDTSEDIDPRVALGGWGQVHCTSCAFDLLADNVFKGIGFGLKSH